MRGRDEYLPVGAHDAEGEAGEQAGNVVRARQREALVGAAHLGGALATGLRFLEEAGALIEGATPTKGSSAQRR